MLPTDLPRGPRFFLRGRGVHPALTRPPPTDRRNSNLALSLISAVHRRFLIAIPIQLQVTSPWKWPRGLRYGKLWSHESDGPDRAARQFSLHSNCPPARQSIQSHPYLAELMCVAPGVSVGGVNQVFPPPRSRGNMNRWWDGGRTEMLSVRYVRNTTSEVMWCLTWRSWPFLNPSQYFFQKTFAQIIVFKLFLSFSYFI